MAFINSMRKAQLAQNDEVHPFGFAVDDKKQHIGVAVGGILYRSDGTRDRVPGLQPAIEAGFQPQGSLDHWKNTFKTVCGGRPELQALVAGSFGAPLMHFTGEKGVTISGWTPESGAAKSSAMTLAQTVWSEPRFMSSMNDTDNMAARLRSVCAFMPSIWDEKLDDKTKAKEFTQLIFSIAQGKEKGRLNSQLEIQELKQWQTLLVVTNNTQLMDNVTGTMTSSDAGALRMLEFFVPKGNFKQDSKVSMALQECQHNYGRAGEKFMEYVAQNYATVKVMMDGVIKQLQASWHTLNEERLYVAGCAAMIVGASIAKKVGAADFDVPALTQFLGDAVISSRSNRQSLSSAMTINGAIDPDEVLAQFCNAMAGSKLVTDNLPVAGGSPKPREIAVPVGSAHVHEVQAAGTFFSVNAFKSWCTPKGYNASTLLKEFEQKMRGRLMRVHWCSQTTKSVPGLMGVMFIPANYMPTAPAPKP